MDVQWNSLVNVLIYTGWMDVQWLGVTRLQLAGTISPGTHAIAGVEP